MNAAAAGAELIPGVRWRWVDETLWVLDKSAGVSVLADRAGAPSVHDALIAWHDAEAGRPRPRLVHRIDKDTSGLLLVAGAFMERSSRSLQREASGNGTWRTLARGRPRGAPSHHTSLTPRTKGPHASR